MKSKEKLRGEGYCVVELMKFDLDERAYDSDTLYGPPVTPFDGLEDLGHAYDEVLKLALWLRKLIEQNKGRQK